MKNPFTWLTREIRTRAVLPFIPAGDLHVDIGCGLEKYLLRKSCYRKTIGFDPLLGNGIIDKIPLEDSCADCVTMLASIEHIEFPEIVIRECHRIIKPQGRLIITTPKQKALWITRLYDPGYEKVEGPHRQYFDVNTMKNITDKYFELMLSREFECGFNQLFVFRKKEIP